MRVKLVRSFVCIVVFALYGFGQAGCSSLNRTLGSWFGKEPPKKVRKVVQRAKKPKKRRKVTRKTLAQQSKLGESSGSLWVPRGQGAYLFHQNNRRLIGDMINVEMDGHPKEQVETKVKVIDKLVRDLAEKKRMRRIVARRKRRLRRKGTKRKVASLKKKGKGGEKAEDPPAKFDVKLVPTRIVGILKDGSYRVHGDQDFMIGKRDYKLVVSGIVRQEDFDDEGISAETLLDPKFDIVTAKRKRGVY